jgi:predicted RNA-binding protein with PIN domain
VSRTLYIVDGYNVLHHLFPGVGRDELFARRDWLLDRLAGYVALRGAGAALVFDGHGPESTSTRPITGADIEVAFAGGRFTADTLIARRIASQAPDTAVIVVSADQEVQRTASRAGVLRMTPRELAAEIAQGPAELADKTSFGQALDSASDSHTMRSRLEDKVDPETLRKLHRLRGGS